MDTTGSRLPSTPRRRRVLDRFIPHREGVNLEAAFSVANSVRATPAPALAPPFSDSPPHDPLDTKTKEVEDARNVYSNLLRSEMFGDDLHLPQSPSTGSLSSTSSFNSTNSLAALAGNTSPQASRGVSGSVSTNSLTRPSLSLPTSPRKLRPSRSVGSTLRFSPPRLLRSESDLSDITMGGGNVSTGGTGLRPESLDLLLQPKNLHRNIRETPFRVLDAPGLVDDFYLNLVHWGTSDRLAVGLSRRVYVWDARNGDVSQVAELQPGESVTSVAWMDSGEHLAVGTSSGLVRIVDAITAETLRTMTGHTARAGSLSWNDHILSTGSADHTILHRDCRIKEHYIARLHSHRGEVCGLTWNTELQQLASGGNDNKLRIWSGVNNAGVSNGFSSAIGGGVVKSVSSVDPLYEFDEHTSAVKALAWSPHQRGLLASGGGFCDRKIWFWNALSGKSINSVETGSQVCALEWSPRAKELISSQGSRYSDVVVWKYPTMQPIARLRGHAHRVLHMGLSPDGRSLATGAGDETLRLWSLYDDDHREEQTSARDVLRQLR